MIDLKLTHTLILDRTWKNKCFPFVVIGIVLPLLCLVVPGGFLISAGLVVLFLILFLRGYRYYMKIQRKEYSVFKQECTGQGSVVNSVDHGYVETKYSFFGDVGDYQHKGTDTHVPFIQNGDTYYLVRLKGTKEILLIFSAEEYTIDTDAYTTKDQWRYKPMK